MDNLQRITGKIFGETATATGNDPQIGQFGSALAGTYVGTTDVATIQNLSAWSNGFIDSVTPSTQFPPLPEMTGFGKVLSYQTAYMMQKGVSEWDANTTYYTGDFCKGVGEGKLYVSLVDNNLNHAVTDAAYWEEFSSGGSDLNLYTTNCIIEIPQDIKLELNNNYLTIKAGTKGYLRSESSDSITTQNDITVGPFTTFPTSYFFVSLQLDGFNYFEADATNCVSASSNPGTNYIIWYNTTEGKCYHNDGSGTPTECTFPIALLKVTNGIGITSIDQIFNGFGYIGSTVFALPGVKGLAPNGRNADGTLKNTEYTLSQVWTIEGYTSPYTIVVGGGINPCYYTNYAAQDTKPSFSNGEWYNTLTNKCYEIRDGVLSPLQFFTVGDVIVNNGKVVSFAFKKPLHLITYSELNEAIKAIMPDYANKVDLTMTAGSSNAYTATYPCVYVFNGYFHQNVGNHFLYLNNVKYGNVRGQDGYHQVVQIYLPLSPGDSIYWDAVPNNISYQYIVPLKGV